MGVILSGAFLLAALAPLAVRLAPRAAGWVLALGPAGACAWLAATDAQGAAVSLPWVPGLGVTLSLRLDGLGRLLALLITGVGALVLVYSRAYLAGHPRLGAFYAYLLAFMASMLGIALADNVLLLYVFWELTSLTSFLLIGFEHQRLAARRAALQALLVTGAGGLCLLAGLVLLGQAGGTFTLSELMARRELLVNSPLYGPALVLVLIGALTKSAHVPFHFWLPNAMEAPTPVSAYLHSSTMVKAGVFLLARLAPGLGATPLWIGLLAPLGALTAVTGAALAWRHSDLKRVLAYSTIAALGLMTLLIGIGSDAALVAAAAWLLVHAFYKGALFLVAGTITHATGERDIARLGGLAPVLPLTAGAALLAAASMAGLPPLGGFVAKELMLEALLDVGPALTGAAVLTAMLLVAVAVTVGLRPFIGRRRPADTGASEGSPAMWLAPMLLASAGVLAGVAPGLFAGPLATEAARAMGAGAELPEVVLWHGLTPALALSTLSLAGGLLLARHWRAPSTHRALFDRGHANALEALGRIASTVTTTLQTGRLRGYLRVVTGVVVGAVALTLLVHANGGPLPPVSPPAAYEVLLLALVLGGMSVTVRTRSLLAAIAGLGAVGYGLALLFLIYGAPDLAMTQAAIDTLTVLLFLFAFRNIPEDHFATTGRGRWRDGLLALGAGAVMAALVLLVVEVPHAPPVSAFFLDHAVSEAHGRNVVNVILVDFRALDTLGEISVLALAGVGVYAVLRSRSGGRGPSS